MADPHSSESSVGTLIGALSLVVTGLVIMFKAALHIGGKERAAEHIADKLERIEKTLEAMAKQKADDHQEIFIALARQEERIQALEDRDSRRKLPHGGE